MKNKLLSPIKDIIKDARKGKMFVLVDDKNRENEGDLVISGSKCNSKNINFMAMHGRGLICLALTKKQVDHMVRLQLPGVDIANADAADALAIALCHAHHAQFSNRLEAAIAKAGAVA